MLAFEVKMNDIQEEMKNKTDKENRAEEKRIREKVKRQRQQAEDRRIRELRRKAQEDAEEEMQNQVQVEMLFRFTCGSGRFLKQNGQHLIKCHFCS